MTKRMTLGWTIVFIFFAVMNLYTASRYLQIQFSSAVNIKQSLYSLIHSMLFVNAVHYFYCFFNGKTEGKHHKLQADLAGFYLIVLHYSFLFHLLYDLIFRYFSPLAYSQIALLITIFSIGIAAYAYINGRKLKMTSHALELPAKASDLKELKAIFISDVHFGVSWNVQRIQSFVKQMNQLDLDLLLIGGDLFDEGSPEKEKEQAVQALSQIKSRYGQFYIEGNHEYKSENSDIETELQRLKKAGITVLEDEVMLIDDRFYLIGRKDDEGKRQELTSILASLEKDYPTILMDHRPHHKEAIQSGAIDLQLSGHTHAGQFLPFCLVNPILKTFFYSYVYGHFQKKNFQLIVSSGMGNWAVPYRFGSQAEFVYLQIYFKNN